jgi:gluconolactonase
VERLDPALDALIPPDAQVERLAEGFTWAEGPVWVEEGAYLLFSDVPQNIVYRWKEGEGKSAYLTPSGYTGPASGSFESGANGLLLDSLGRLLLCQHGDRRVARMEAPLSAPAPSFSTLAGSFGGKRFNSPNDACLDRAGILYFTDPPYGLSSPEARELPFQGIYRVEGDSIRLLDSLSRPNGIALSPDERRLYVANSDPDRAFWMAYDLAPDGSVAGKKVFFDATANGKAGELGLPDGLKVDAKGNLFATGPGGVWVFSPEGRPLGRIRLPMPSANCAFGPGHLYITADSYLLRVKLR